MSSPAALPSTSRRLSFPTADGSRTLVGVLNSAAKRSSSGGNRCALLCHGMLMSGQDIFFPALAQALLAAPASALSSATSTGSAAARPIVDHVFRLDFSGHGGASTGGHFSYGGYARLVEEIEETVRFLQREEQLQIDLLVGHSMGANSVMLYAATHCTAAAVASSSPLRIPRVVAISPRFDMTVDHRFDKAALLGLLKEGVMYLRRGAGKAPLPITIEEYQARLRLDMTCVQHIAATAAHTLLMHGGNDAVIPQRDSFRMHHWLTAKCEERESGALPVARESTYVPLVDLMDRSASSPPLSDADFVPPLAAALPHAFVPIPGASHMFDSARESSIVCALVCAWAELHSEFAAANVASSAASSDAAGAGAKTQGAKL